MQIIAPALRSMVAYFNWTRIALLTQDEGLFTGVGFMLLCYADIYVRVNYLKRSPFDFTAVVDLCDLG